MDEITRAPTADVAQHGLLIGGAWQAASAGETFENRNPADLDELVGRFAAAGAQDATAAVDAAAAAFRGWRAAAPSKRAALLEGAAGFLEARADALGAEMCREMGKPLPLAVGEVKRAAQTLRFYATEGQTLTGETFPQDDPAMTVMTVREPLGVASVITPFNFPVSIPARKIAPALVTGNTVVFKPSSDAPLIGLRLAEAFQAAGAPPGVVNCVTGASGAVGAALTADPRVRAISFTGSTGAGEAIHRSLPLTTRAQMELGGKNPILVMADADVDTAVKLTAAGAFNLTGQACTCTSRALVHASLYEEFVERLATAARALKVGDGAAAGTELGPLASQRQLSAVLSYMEIGASEARLVTGGRRLSGGDHERGFFVEPTVFADVTTSMRIAQEEIFGPVVAVQPVSGYEEAIAEANAVRYGLAASLVTQDFALIQRFASDIEAGTVKVNRPTTGNLVNAPFGGVKMSSTATFRESGRAGLDFFTETKTVYLGR